MIGISYTIHLLNKASQVCITITCPCNKYPLLLHFYTVKLRFAGGIPIFLIFAPKYRLWVLVRTASIYVLSKKKNKKKKKHQNFSTKNFHFFTTCFCNDHWFSIQNDLQVRLYPSSTLNQA